jgi:hypothetical protein
VRPYVRALLERQEGAGHWPAWAANYGFFHLRDGTPALTTAIAVEALAGYLAGSQRRASAIPRFGIAAGRRMRETPLRARSRSSR